MRWTSPIWTCEAVQIRTVFLDDAERIAAIYARHVRHGTATFDTVPMPVEAMAAKIGALLARGYPWLVAEEDGLVVGYAYAAPFRDRPAYAATVEDSIYLDPDWTGRGIGKALLIALIDASAAAGFRQMIGIAGGGEPASVALHLACGFSHAGRMVAVGRKFGRWLDTVYMQRALGPGDATPPQIEPG
jgi:L-amino acid N-acyltransferase YncA